jgi:hypothetical protein
MTERERDTLCELFCRLAMLDVMAERAAAGLPLDPSELRKIVAGIGTSLGLKAGETVH